MLQPMLIKPADDLSPDVAALRALRDRAELDPGTRARADADLRKVQAGIKGERAAAYEIEFLLGANKNRATIHDLRIEVGGRVAQIDHLIIDRLLGFTVCESKHFSGGVRINELGEWTTTYQGIEVGVPSPIEQNRKHIKVLKDLFDRGIVELPGRLGLAKPRFYSLILISTNARIDRPKSRAAKRIASLDSVIKVDQLEAALERQWALGRELDLVRAVSATTMKRIATDLAALHQPRPTDWAAKFGVTDQATPAITHRV